MQWLNSYIAWQATPPINIGGVLAKICQIGSDTVTKNTVFTFFFDKRQKIQTHHHRCSWDLEAAKKSTTH